MADLVAAFGQVLLNRRRPYALQQSDGSYRWVHRVCTPDVLQAHLAGMVTVAASSLDAGGMTRWVCLDSDAPGGLGELLRLRTALADLGFSGIAEASRRGGHLWLLLAGLAPAAVARRAVQGALARLKAEGMPVPALELYPDADRGLGHAVRLPLGVHRRSGQRYPLLGSDGRPLAFSSTAGALAWLVAQPRIPLAWLRASWAPPLEVAPVDAVLPSGRGARSAVIRWVDAAVAPLDLLAELAPASALRPVGQGWLGWCPFHDDAAPQADGAPGTPSLYVVRNARYGWSWRCLSTHCRYHAGPLHHSFDLFCALRGVEVRTGIAVAARRWPDAGKGSA